MEKGGWALVRIPFPFVYRRSDVDGFFPAFCYTSSPGWTVSLWNCEPGQAAFMRVFDLSQQGEDDEDSSQTFLRVFCFDLLVRQGLVM